MKKLLLTLGAVAAVAAPVASVVACGTTKAEAEKDITVKLGDSSEVFVIGATLGLEAKDLDASTLKDGKVQDGITKFSSEFKQKMIKAGLPAASLVEDTIISTADAGHTWVTVDHPEFIGVFSTGIDVISTTGAIPSDVNIDAKIFETQLKLGGIDRDFEHIQDSVKGKATLNKTVDAKNVVTADADGNYKFASTNKFANINGFQAIKFVA